MSDAVDDDNADSRAIATEIDALSAQLEGLLDGVGLDGAAHNVSAESADRLEQLVTRLYAVALAREPDFVPPGTGASTTETVTVISALMQAQNLNTFDLALWQSKLRRS